MLKQKSAQHQYVSALSSDAFSSTGTKYIAKVAVGSGIVIAPNNQNYRKRKKRFHLSNIIEDDRHFQHDLTINQNMYSTKLQNLKSNIKIQKINCNEVFQELLKSVTDKKDEINDKTCYKLQLLPNIAKQNKGKQTNIPHCKSTRKCKFEPKMLTHLQYFKNEALKTKLKVFKNLDKSFERDSHDKTSYRQLYSPRSTIKKLSLKPNLQEPQTNDKKADALNPWSIHRQDYYELEFTN